MASQTEPSAEELKVEYVAEEKYHEDRISHVERNFSGLSMCMGGVARKTALMRDKGDKLAKLIQDMSAGETGSLKTALDGLSDCFGGLEDYRQTELDRLEAKVVKPLLEYDNVCRKAKEELRACHTDRVKVVNQQRNLDRMRIREPSNRKRITQLETTLQKAKFQRLQSSKSLEDYMHGFERKRVHDLKEILGEYIHIEMVFHAKALELFTVAYQHLESINEDEAIESFQNGLQQRKRGGVLNEPLPSNTPIHRTGSEPSLTSQP